MCDENPEMFFRKTSVAQKRMAFFFSFAKLPEIVELKAENKYLKAFKKLEFQSNCNKAKEFLKHFIS